MFIKLRPGLKEVLAELKQYFELILFTSSSKVYCEGLIKNVIENSEQFFEHKLYKSQCSL